MDVLVLDSPFSGLDSAVLANITNRLFGPDSHFKQSGRSVILVTNNCKTSYITHTNVPRYILTSSDQILSHADNILVFDSGTVSAQGSYQKISATIPHLFSELVHGTSDGSVSPKEPIRQGVIEEIADVSPALESSAQEQDMLRQKSSWTVYSYYTKAAGVFLFTLSVSAMMGECFGSSFSSECGANY